MTQPDTRYGGHVFVRPLGDPLAEATCTTCGRGSDAWTKDRVECGPVEPEPEPEAPDLEGGTQAEKLGLLVAGVVTTIERDRDRALSLLDALVRVTEAQGTTFAHDTRAVDEAAAFLAEVRSTESPQDQEPPT